MSNVRRLNMSWLTAHYLPGFQEDITSWVLTIDAQGQVTQEVDVHRFSPEEAYKETYRSNLSAEKMKEIGQLLQRTEFSEIDRAANLVVVDDTEQVRIALSSRNLVTCFTAPLDYWSSQKASGATLLPAQLSAVALWQVLLPLSKYEARRAKDA